MLLGRRIWVSRILIVLTLAAFTAPALAALVNDARIHVQPDGQAAWLLVGSLGCMALAVLDGLLLTRMELGPLRSIRSGIERIASGELSVELGISGNDELAQLAGAFDAMASRLRQERADRERGESELALTASALAARSAELEHRNNGMDLVGEMANRLLAAKDEREFCSIVERYAPRILPETRGALYSIPNSRANVRALGGWGGEVSSAADFVPGDCWAIRRGRPHLVSASSIELKCRHVHPEWEGNYSCLPLIAQGETVGLLYVEALEGRGIPGGHERYVLNETIAASLVNLRLRDSLRDQSTRDPLTGLFNRRYLDESFELECSRAQRSKQPLSVLMADIDHFKRFNDVFGHEAGDVVLTQFGELLKRSVRRGDIVCRFGGEEFVIVLPGSDLTTAKVLADTLRMKVGSYDFASRGHGLGKVTVSVGVADYPRSGSSPEALLSAADQALYAAKANGRDRSETFEPNIHKLDTTMTTASVLS
jgi:diguanylate cyclase (GGDEF)-like protein